MNLLRLWRGRGFPLELMLEGTPQGGRLQPGGTTLPGSNNKVSGPWSGLEPQVNACVSGNSVEMRVHVSAVWPCVSGPRRCLLDTSVFLDPMRLSGSMHVGKPV